MTQYHKNDNQRKDECCAKSNKGRFTKRNGSC